MARLPAAGMTMEGMQMYADQYNPSGDLCVVMNEVASLIAVVSDADAEGVMTVEDLLDQSRIALPKILDRLNLVLDHDLKRDYPSLYTDGLTRPSNEEAELIPRNASRWSRRRVAVQERRREALGANEREEAESAV